MEFEIWGITDRTSSRPTLPYTFYSSATGLEDARSFMNYLVTLQPIEFMEDASSPSTFVNVLLDPNSASKKGTAYQIKTMGAPGWYTTGVLQFREQST